MMFTAIPHNGLQLYTVYVVRSTIGYHSNSWASCWNCYYIL